MAQRGVNKVILVGKLGQDPEIRYMNNGGAVANLSVATSESWRDKSTGENKEVTEWHRVVIFGKLAEIAGEYLRKGSQVYLEGQLKTRKWEKDGVERYTTEIHIPMMGGVMQMLGGKQDSGQQQHSGTPSQQQQQSQRQQTGQQRQSQQPAPQQQGNNEPPMNFDGDIPFASIGLQYSSHAIHSI